jgi:serine phosphatase RsbU (regulator of sigma subunit)
VLSGERLLLITDGVYEPRSGDPDQGDTQVVRLIAQQESGGRELLTAVWSDIEPRLRLIAKADDVTLMAIIFAG